MKFGGNILGLVQQQKAGNMQRAMSGYHGSEGEMKNLSRAEREKIAKKKCELVADSLPTDVKERETRQMLLRQKLYEYNQEFDNPLLLNGTVNGLHFESRTDGSETIDFSYEITRQSKNKSSLDTEDKPSITVSMTGDNCEIDTSKATAVLNKSAGTFNSAIPGLKGTIALDRTTGYIEGVGYYEAYKARIFNSRYAHAEASEYASGIVGENPEFEVLDKDSPYAEQFQGLLSEDRSVFLRTGFDPTSEAEQNRQPLNGITERHDGETSVSKAKGLESGGYDLPFTEDELKSLESRCREIYSFAHEINEDIELKQSSWDSLASVPFAGEHSS